MGEGWAGGKCWHFASVERTFSQAEPWWLKQGGICEVWGLPGSADVTRLPFASRQAGRKKPGSFLEEVSFPQWGMEKTLQSVGADDGLPWGLQDPRILSFYRWKVLAGHSL